jgi:RNA polymerase sigma-70 factor (ECF subfamily)
VDLPFLIRRAQEGEPRAFERLVREYRDRIFRWALVRTGDEDDAEDATQEALVRLHRGLRKFRGASRFETWLYAITRNAAADVTRRGKRRKRMADRYAELAEVKDARRIERPLDDLAARRAAGLVRAFLGDLPMRQREALDLVDLQGMAPAEAAVLLGSNPATLRTHLYRARRAMRNRLLDERWLAEGES